MLYDKQSKDNPLIFALFGRQKGIWQAISIAEKPHKKSQLVYNGQFAQKFPSNINKMTIEKKDRKIYTNNVLKYMKCRKVRI